MEPAASMRCTLGMRRLALVALLVALVAGPSADAKFRLTLNVSPAQPAAGDVVRAVLTADVRADEDVDMRLVAVAPGARLYTVLGAESRSLEPPGPSFAVPLVRRGGGGRWVGTLRFERRGTWRLVVPNWGAAGYAIPPPIVRTIVVR